MVEHASGCVLIGREAPSDKQVRILVPVDGSSGSEQALDAFTSYFDLESADITPLHVVEKLWLPTEEEEESTDPEFNETAQFLLEMKREGEQLLTETRARFLQHHSGVTTSIREGVPANEILSEADQGDYDLVVVGATCATDMKHSILGSVSSKIAWNAPGSVQAPQIRVGRSRRPACDGFENRRGAPHATAPVLAKRKREIPPRLTSRVSIRSL